MINFQELLEKELNYGTKDPDDVDSKLLFMGIKQHLSNPETFKNILNRTSSRKSPSFRLQEIRGLHPELASRYGHVKISMSHVNKTNSGFHAVYKPRNKEIALHKFNSLHPNMLTGSHIFDIHRSFLKELSRKFIPFTHEFKHLSDDLNNQLTDATFDSNDLHSYYNEPGEFNAFLHEKIHHITRDLIQNNSVTHGYTPNEKYYEHLPLRKRLYLYRNHPIENKLHIIDDHTSIDTGVSHKTWFEHLNLENRKKAKAKLEPIINKYMVSNPGY